MEENQNPQGGLFAYKKRGKMDENVRKHGKIRRRLHKMKKRTLNRIFLVVLIALSLISGITLVDIWMKERQERIRGIQEREQLAKIVRKTQGQQPYGFPENRLSKPGSSETKSSETRLSGTGKFGASMIDFTYLTSCNPDTVAWLSIPGTNIDYPVVQSKDNETYMSRDFYGEENKSGTIFLDFQSELPVKSRKNCVFYGHYMKNGSMFRDIARYQDKTYFDTHRQIWLYTPQATQELEAVEWFSAPNSEKLRERCLTEQTKGTYAFITCSYDGRDNRGILWAREVSRNEKQP